MTKFVSNPIRLPVRELENEFERADLEFHGVDHSGPSFEARVFLNNPDADESTKLTEDSGYVGSFYIFGHGGCYGDFGHCEVPAGARRPFDKRPPHPLKPVEKRLTVTEVLRKIAEKSGEITVTVVPVLPLGISGDVLHFEGVSIVTYD